MKVMLHPQKSRWDCGPACIKMVADFFEIPYSFEDIKKLCRVTNIGTSLHHLENACKKIGLDCIVTKFTWEQMIEIVRLPCIVLINGNHYVALFPQKNILQHVIVHDPGKQSVARMPTEEFVNAWVNKNNNNHGYALIFATK